jgi:RimJ/RimL family protein N-acetyltransferase
VTSAPAQSVSLRLLTPDEARDIVAGRRPAHGWARDFPGDGDRVGARLATFPDADRGTPWFASWLILVGDSVVGTIGCKGAPRDGTVEVGYGVAPSARRRGVASAALAQLLERLDECGLVVEAETLTDNAPSQAVLRRQGFAAVGTRRDPDDGELIRWRRPRPGDGAGESAAP